jgi:chemotaxis family two-component system sensor kinase Cph1
VDLKRGDHVCAIYSSRSELAQTVADFLANGLRLGERCWYVASSDESDAIRVELHNRDVDVGAQTARKALNLVSADQAYVVHGNFNPEATLKVFNDTIEQAYGDGFAAFRAAADMSWALDHEDGPYQLVLYEALLRQLFASCRATGLCLYDRARMPLAVINGALETHPIAGSHGEFHENPFYDPKTNRMSVVDDADVLGKLAHLDRSKRPHRFGL